MKNVSRRMRLPWIALAGLLLVAQSLPSLADIKLGQWSLLNPPAMSLNGANLLLAQSSTGIDQAAPSRPTKRIQDAAQSLAFLSKVGGVAFGSEAKGVDGREIVSIAYDANRADGERLSVTIRSKQGRDTVAQGHFADWLIVPAAHLAAGDDISCVTLFGKLQDPVDDKKHREAGHSIVNYNSNLEGTLLGLRLMQADLLLLDPVLAPELPRTEAGYLLGLGEARPNLEENQRRAIELNRYVSNLQGGPFQSYLICDFGVEITFTVENATLEFSGSPYWYCWRYKTRDNAAFAAIQEEANVLAKEDLQREAHPGALTDQAARQARYDELFDQQVSRKLLEYMPAYSAAVSTEIKYTEGGNPAVYEALTGSMRLTAFFRTARRQCPEKWRRFLESLPDKGIRSPEWAVTVITAPSMTRSESTGTHNSTH